MQARCSRDKGTQIAEDVAWDNSFAKDMADDLDKAIVFRNLLDWNNKILINIGDCSHADSNVYDEFVQKTHGYRSEGARLHVLATPDLWEKLASMGIMGNPTYFNT